MYAEEFTISQLMRWMKKHNPNLDCVNSFDSPLIICETPEDLVLPDGFYYTEKNGITNKHNTRSGYYISLTVMVPDLTL